MPFDHSFGIEEEFFLVDATTGALGTPALDQLMSDARAKLGDIVTSELLQSQIEIASPILHGHAEAADVMSRTRRELSAGCCGAWVADRCGEHASVGGVAGAARYREASLRQVDG